MLTLRFYGRAVADECADTFRALKIPAAVLEVGHLLVVRPALATSDEIEAARRLWLRLGSRARRWDGGAHATETGNLRRICREAGVKEGWAWTAWSEIPAGERECINEITDRRGYRFVE